MSGYILAVAAALERLQNGIAPTADDIKITAPYLDKLIAEARIPFQHLPSGFGVGTVKLGNLTGLQVMSLLLISPGTDMHCKQLLAMQGDKSIPKTEERSRQVLRDYQTDWGEIGMSETFQDAADRKTISEVQREIAAIEDAALGGLHADLGVLQGYLATCVFRGQPIRLRGESERARQAVKQAIAYALKVLSKNPETAYIADHLKKHIVTGTFCRYTGTWKWRF